MPIKFLVLGGGGYFGFFGGVGGVPILFYGRVDFFVPLSYSASVFGPFPNLSTHAERMRSLMLVTMTSQAAASSMPLVVLALLSVQPSLVHAREGGPSQRKSIVGQSVWYASA